MWPLIIATEKLFDAIRQIKINIQFTKCKLCPKETSNCTETN